MQNDRRIDDLTHRSIALLQSLVAFDSVSRNSNLPIIAFIENYLQQHIIPCIRVPSPDGTKSNLLARIGPEAAGGIIFSGHTDVVPVDGQPWESDPFTLLQRDTRLFGRGTADMKSFIAVCLALVPEFVAMTLPKPLWFAFSYDEEVGCLGAPHLLDYMVTHIPSPSFALIGEPTMLQVVTAHKGVVSFETTVTGLEWHSSQPHLGVNAVNAACELIHFLNSLSPWERAGVRATYQNVAGPHPDPLPEGEGRMRDERFDPPYSTVHVRTIHGGTARNIIPRECTFQWEIRPLPGENYDAIIERFTGRCNALRSEMQKKYAQADIVSQPMSHMSGVTLPAEAHVFCQAVMRSALTNRELAVSFGTEAGVFNDHGIPAIICGPGNIEQAHKPNEFIDIAQIRACVAFMLRLTSDASIFKK